MSFDLWAIITSQNEQLEGKGSEFNKEKYGNEHRSIDPTIDDVWPVATRLSTGNQGGNRSVASPPISAMIVRLNMCIKSSEVGGPSVSPGASRPGTTFQLRYSE